MYKKMPTKIGMVFTLRQVNQMQAKQEQAKQEQAKQEQAKPVQMQAKPDQMQAKQLQMKPTQMGHFQPYFIIHTPPSSCGSCGH